ncbi:MAG TPA: type II toxin-antitoxin system RelE/ParE family toxin [Acetobacteraceae bacterium]|nr:type II toxin-antitoxin system RelE/ParE family toxin [Acetobacteraceae bacterium]
MVGTLGAGEADLGRGLFKKRFARPGGGKRGGYRMIVACRQPGTEKVLFTYAFAKNAASTLTPQGHEALAKVAEAFLTADDGQVAALLASGDVNEVECNDDEQG